MTDYQEYIRFRASLAGAEIDVISKPGFSNWDEITPATHLIAEHVTPGGRVLVMGSNHGAAAVRLAQHNSTREIWLADQNSISLDCSRRTLAANHILQSHVSERISLLPECTGQFDTVVIEAPKGRQLTRRWLVEAYHLLRPGGTAYLAGSNDLGIKSCIQDATQLFGNSSILDYKKGSRIVRLIKDVQDEEALPFWISDFGIAPGTWITFPLKLEDQVFTIQTLPGVFSQGRLDDGTAMLLQHIHTPIGTRILDIGCGCGIIGLVLAMRLRNARRTFTLDMVDSNLLAVASTQANCENLHLNNIQVLSSDLLESVKGRAYDFIVSNPPFHTGKKVNYSITEALIQQSYQALEKGGRLILVANRFIRYERVLENFFPTVSCLVQDNRYVIIEAKK